MRRLLDVSALVWFLMFAIWGRGLAQTASADEATVRQIALQLNGSQALGVHVERVEISGDDATVSVTHEQGKSYVFLHRFPFGWQALGTNLDHRYHWQPTAKGDPYRRFDSGPWSDVVAVRRLYQRKYPHGFGQPVSIVHDYAVGGTGDWNTGCALLFKRTSGEWREIAIARGAFDDAELVRLGVPPAIVHALYPGQRQTAMPSAPLRQLSGSGSYLAPNSNTRQLTLGELSGLSARDLTLMRNEIYARHGRIFKDTQLRAYFHAQAWYHESSRYSDAMLNGFERRNIQFILQYQEAHGLSW